MNRLTRVAIVVLLAAWLTGGIVPPASAEIEKAEVAILGGMQCSL